MLGLLSGFAVIVIGLIFGQIAERKHFARLKETEQELSGILLTNVKHMSGLDTSRGTLVTGNVVIANDAFKKFISGFMMFFGGRVSVFETLMERARREALVRMTLEARELGASSVINIRIETSTILGKSAKSVGSIEMLAYGTAISQTPRLARYRSQDYS